jgi:hypothetical protein
MNIQDFIKSGKRVKYNVLSEQFKIMDYILEYYGQYL